MMCGMTMDASGLARELTEADVQAQQGAARALVLARLERLYAYCEANLGYGDGGDFDGAEKADPRFAELAVRIIDREVKLYRLDRPAPVAGDDDDEGVERERTTAAVLAQLTQLEERTRAPR